MISALKTFVNTLQEAGFTQRQIAAKTGVNQATISRLGSGELTELDYSRGKKIELLAAKVRKQRRP